jgi:hypothetical protein
MLRRLGDALGRIAPRSVAERLRGVAALFLAPLRFSLIDGHARSALARRAMTASGQPLPWYSYPAIAFLDQTEVAGRQVLECGGGQSTRWWLERGASVTTLESHAAWAQELRERIGSRARIETVHDSLADLHADIASAQNEVVVVDGLDRVRAAQLALRCIKPDGAILVDNSEGNWGSPGTYPIVDLLQGAGYSRVDFHGYGPGTRLPHCTSLFFRNTCFLLRPNSPPQRRF